MQITYLYEDENYTIKRYYPQTNEDDYRFINDRKIVLWNFFDTGYKYAGLTNGFRGSCETPKSMLKNAAVVKICWYQDNIIAASVYTNYLGGFKCVGITVTIDPKYRVKGVEAVKNIIAEDVGLQSKFFWCECSDAIEYLYSKAGGIQIPSCYAHLFMPAKNITIEDNYHFSYISKKTGETFVKTIYGINDRETLAKILRTSKNQNLISALHNVFKLHEENEPTNKFDAAVLFIQMLQDYRLDGFCEFQPEILNGAQKCVDYLYTKYKETKNSDERFQIKSYINAGEDVIESSTALELHTELLGLEDKSKI